MIEGGPELLKSWVGFLVESLCNGISVGEACVELSLMVDVAVLIDPQDCSYMRHVAHLGGWWDHDE